MFVNKWNRRKYELVSSTNDKVVLRRGDGSMFTITISEFKFSYREEAK